MKRHFAGIDMPVTLKYIDPSYTIRAAPDGFYCVALAHPVHAAMAGRTGILVGRYHGVFAHVPIALAIERRSRVDEELWQAVREVTGQPALT